MDYEVEGVSKTYDWGYKKRSSTWQICKEDAADPGEPVPEKCLLTHTLSLWLLYNIFN